MSKTLAGSSANFSSNVVVPTDGDPRNAASVETPFQRNLDNETYLFDQLITQGTRKVRQVPDAATLKAINPASAGYVTGDVVWLIGTYGYGMYRYDSTSAVTEAPPWILAPTVGSGRWIHAQYDLRERMQSAGDDTTNVTISSALVSAPTVVKTLTLPGVQGGAKVRVMAHFATNPAGGNGVVSIRISENGGTAASVLGCTETFVPGTYNRAWVGAKSIVAAGPVVVTLDAYRNGATTMSVLAPYSLVAEVSS